MMTSQESENFERLIDANLNRLKEGLRVLEDIQRYIFNQKNNSYKFKNLRHSLREAYSPKRIIYRDIDGDVLKESTMSEMQRKTIQDLNIANFSRVQESARVLEEAFKLKDKNLSTLFKNIRYKLYSLEKDILGLPEKSNNSNSK